MTTVKRVSGRMGDRFARYVLTPLRDERDRAEVLADFEALRRKGGHSRGWYWRELIRYGWALRFDPSAADVSSGPKSGRSLAGGGLIASVIWDVRYAFRVLARSPGLTLVALPTIALSIGATTALFSFADALLLRPLSVREPERLLSLFHVSTQGPRAYSSFSYPDYVELRGWSRQAGDVAAFSSAEMRLGDGGEMELVEAQIVSGNYFSVLGVTLSVGRAFLPEEDRTQGTHPVVVISRRLMERRFGGDRSVVGRSIILNGQSFTVVGVAPASTPSIDLGGRPDLWVPLMMHEVVLPGFHAFGRRLFDNRGTHWLELITRLPAGVDAERAGAELGELARRQAVENPETNRGWSIAVVAAATARLGPPSGRPLARLTGLLTVVVTMVLLIACANVANLLLARASTRFHEMGVRMSIGASRARLLRQSLTEALLLAALGGGLGVMLAMACMRLLPALDLTAGLAGLDVRLDARVLMFASVVSLGTGLVFGLVPALRASSIAAARSDRWASTRGDAGRPVVRQSLVVAQVALALVLLIGAGLALRTLWNLQRIPLGFEPRNLVLASVDLAQGREPGPDDLRIYERIIERVRSLQGVRDAAWARVSPFSGRRMANDILWETGDSTGGRGRTNVDMNVVDTRYFQTLGIALLAGREFSAEDRQGTPGVAVVNQALAARLWPGENPVGKRLWEWRTNEADRALSVIGVVANGRYYRSWQTAERPFVFIPLAQNSPREMTLHMRATGSAFPLEDSLRRVIADVATGITPPRMRTAAEAMAASVSLQRTNARLLTLFAVLATIVAMIGVYGVVSFTVSQRTHEIGVRMALGARPADVRRMVLIGSAKPMLAGIALGFVAAAMLTRFLAPLLFGVSPWDPMTFGIVAAGQLGVGLLATHVPARRATSVDPLLVLRE